MPQDPLRSVLRVVTVLALSAAPLLAQLSAPHASPAGPTCPRGPSEVLLPPASADGIDLFGSSALIHDGVLLLGHRGDETLGENAGAVRLFERDGAGWAPADVLYPSALSAHLQFGWSLAVHEDLLAVGAPSPAAPAVAPAAVYLFRRDGAGRWQEVAVLHGNAVEQPNAFGATVAVHDDVVVVGAPFEDSPLKAAAGLLYVFEPDGRGGWEETAQLYGTSLPNGAILGASLAFDGTWIVAGAPYAAVEYVSGRAVFARRDARGAWSIVQESVSPQSSGRDRFGAAVALQDGRAWIGSPHDLPPLLGSVHAFELDDAAAVPSWDPVQSFFSPAPATYDRFGNALAVRAGRLAVGAPTDGAGRVWLYELFEGLARPRCVLDAPAPLIAQQFGQQLRFAGSTLLVGNPDDGTHHVYGGSLALYALGALGESESLGVK